MPAICICLRKNSVMTLPRGTYLAQLSRFERKELWVAMMQCRLCSSTMGDRPSKQTAVNRGAIQHSAATYLVFQSRSSKRDKVFVATVPLSRCFDQGNSQSPTSISRANTPGSLLHAPDPHTCHSHTLTHILSLTTTNITYLLAVNHSVDPYAPKITMVETRKRKYVEELPCPRESSADTCPPTTILRQSARLLKRLKQESTLSPTSPSSGDTSEVDSDSTLVPETVKKPSRSKPKPTAKPSSPPKATVVLKRGRKWEIFFGREIRDSAVGVTDELLASFLESEVTTRFPGEAPIPALRASGAEPWTTGARWW